MDFEELFYDFLIEAKTEDELDRLISEIKDDLMAAEYRVVEYRVAEVNNLWEHYKKEEAE